MSARGIRAKLRSQKKQQLATRKRSKPGAFDEDNDFLPSSKHSRLNQNGDLDDEIEDDESTNVSSIAEELTVVNCSITINNFMGEYNLEDVVLLPHFDAKFSDRWANSGDDSNSLSCTVDTNNDEIGHSHLKFIIKMVKSSKSKREEENMSNQESNSNSNSNSKEESESNFEIPVEMPHANLAAFLTLCDFFTIKIDENMVTKYFDNSTQFVEQSSFRQWKLSSNLILAKCAQVFEQENVFTVRKSRRNKFIARMKSKAPPSMIKRHGSMSGIWVDLFCREMKKRQDECWSS